MSNEATDWLGAIDADELPEGKAVRVEVAGTGVVLVRTAPDSVFAVAARCTHQGAPLDRGKLDLRGSDPTVTCPAHGSVFSLVDGRVRRGPATQPVEAFDARLNDGKVQLRPRL
ncbi:MAG: Rieske (2Fe-2S) protein [Actinomycetota bacterium]